MIRVVAAVVERNERYLLGLRPREKRHGGLWEFPGGKLDEGETVEEAAHRELREEMEVEVVRVGPHLLSIADEDSPFVIEFHGVAISGEPVPREHDRLGWFTPAELTAMALAPADRSFAETLLTTPGR